MKRVYVIAILAIGLLFNEAAIAQSSLSSVTTTIKVKEVRIGGSRKLSFKIRSRLNEEPTGECSHTIRGLATSTNKSRGTTVRLRTKRSSSQNVIFQGFTSPVDGDEDNQTKLTVYSTVDCADDDVTLESAPDASNVTCADGVSRSVFTSQLKRFVR